VGSIPINSGARPGGNGRIGRLLMPLMLAQRGVLPQPLLYLSAYFEAYRSEYYDHLLITSRQGTSCHG